MYKNIVNNFWIKKMNEYRAFGILRVEQLPKGAEHLGIILQTPELKVVFYDGFYGEYYIEDELVLTIYFGELAAVQQWAVYIGMKLYGIFYINTNEHALEIIADVQRDLIYR